jgi:diaminopimelate epimerase
MQIDFLKIHGLGNDFIIVDERQDTIMPENKKAKFAKKYCQRRFSIGADGVLFLERANNVDVNMRIFNSDGSEAENCVNGLRCVAFALYKIDGLHGSREFDITTKAGPVHTDVDPISSQNAMVEIDVLGRRDYLGTDNINIEGRDFEYHSVNVGNPHAVIFLDEPVDDFDVEKYGHAMEYHEKFRPDRTNTEFVNLIKNGTLMMRVHERGVCETQACGSGSLATIIAASEAGYVKKNEWIAVKQPGGILEILYGNELRLKGQVELSYKGIIHLT